MSKAAGKSPGTRLNNAVLSYWIRAMDEFFTRVDQDRTYLGMSADETYDALSRGYGAVVADNWTEWLGDEE